MSEAQYASVLPDVPGWTSEAGEIAAVGRIRNAAVDTPTCCYRNADPSSSYSRRLETRRHLAGQDERADCFQFRPFEPCW
jgi:hypothetical protein